MKLKSVRPPVPSRYFLGIFKQLQPSPTFLNSPLVGLKPFPLHPNFLMFSKRHLPHLTCNGVQVRLKFLVHEGWRKAFEQVIWLRIPHLIWEVPSQIICSLGPLRKWLIFTTPVGRLFAMYFLSKTDNFFFVDSCLFKKKMVKACKKEFWGVRLLPW